MEFYFQKTLGKFITKTTVVRLDGNKPTLNNIIARTVFRLLPFTNLSLLYSKIGQHDKQTGTAVVKDIS